MAAVFVMDPGFFDAALNTQQMQNAMVSVAESGAAYAETVAPVVTGEYEQSFSAEPAQFATRKGALLVNESTHAIAAEWEHGHHTLGLTAAKLEADSR